MSALRGVLFDATGTLFALREPVGDVYARAARARGVEIAPWRLEDAFARILRGRPAMLFPDVTDGEIAAHERGWWREAVRQTFRAADSSVRFDDFNTLFESLFRHFESDRAWQLRPGIPAALRELRGRGLRLGIVSNFDHRLPRILEALEIDGFFDCVVRPGTCRAAKPDPRIFEAALRALEMRAEAAAYVGNDPALDLESARRAGLAAVDAGDLASCCELPARLEALATLGR